MAAKPGPKSDKFWAEAVRMAVMEPHEIDGKKIKRLRVVADKIVEMAMSGDIAAIREIGDRLDGRPKQTTDANVTMDASDRLAKLVADVYACGKRVGE